DRGDAYFRLRMWDRAVEDFTRAIASGVDNYSVRGQRGIAYYQLGECAKAIADCSKALALDPSDWSCRVTRGDAYADLGRWDEAAKDFSRAIQLSPQEFTSWYRLAYVQLAMGSIDRYRRVCEEMLTRFGRSDDPTTLSNLARALMEARDGQMN